MYGVQPSAASALTAASPRIQTRAAVQSLHTTQKIGEGGTAPLSARSPEAPDKSRGYMPAGRVQLTEDVDSDTDRGVSAAGKKTVQRRSPVQRHRASVNVSLAAKGASPRPISMTHLSG
jgi:hypothetical protein